MDGIVFLILIGFYAWQTLYKLGFIDFFYKQLGKKITIEGYVAREGLSCWGSGSSAKEDIIYTPTPYVVVDESEASHGRIAPLQENVEGKRVRVQGTTSGTTVLACPQGKPQRIQYISVTNIEPL